MPAYLQVRQVRDAIYLQALRGAPPAAAESSQTQPSNRALGTVFHDAIASLFSADCEQRCATALMLAESSLESWQSSLRSMLYRNSVGPYLRNNQAALQSSSPEVLTLWLAAENFSAWLAPLLWRAHQDFGWPNSDPPFATCEDQMSWQLREPGWTDAVHLSGVADLVLRVPRPQANAFDWCVIEFKIGRTSPEADLAQACLYHEMLLAGMPPGSAPAAGTLALVSFTPERHERLFETSRLAGARAQLKTLIGALAGVASKAVPPSPAGTSQRPDLLEMERSLLKTFAEFQAPAERAGEPIAGPVFFRFFLTPARGIKTKSLIGLADEIQVRLKLGTPPIIGMSKGRIAVDVERSDRQTVTFSSVRAQLPTAEGSRGSSLLPVGVDLSGRLVLADLSETQHTHILVVGTTGSGKSEWLRTAIAGLILGNTPATLQLVLIDPKRTAFNQLAQSLFLQDGKIVYPDEKSVVEVFERLVDEMEDRYRHLQTAGVDDLRGLLAAGIHLPRIVCICDEYADLLSGTRQQRTELERQITRLGSKARAAGIHLIIATQEASRETIKGALDANLPARVGLRTNKDIESRLLLQQNGAEKLLGHGDLLFKDIGAPTRLQAPLLSPGEREEIFQSHSQA